MLISQVGAQLLVEVFSQRDERGSIIITSNLPFEEWPAVFRSAPLTARTARPAHVRGDRVETFWPVTARGKTYDARRLGDGSEFCALFPPSAQLPHSPACNQAYGLCRAGAIPRCRMSEMATPSAQAGTSDRRNSSVTRARFALVTMLTVFPPSLPLGSTTVIPRVSPGASATETAA